MKKFILLFSCCLFVACLSCPGSDGSEQNSGLTGSRRETNIDVINIKLEDAKLKQAAKENESVKAKDNKKSLMHVILMYLPNRLIDLTDIITMEAGFGPEASCELTFTKYCQFGVAYGDRYFLEKGYNRQYGGGYHSGYNASFVCLSDEMAFTDYTFGTVEPYIILDSESDIPCPYSKPYSDGIKDFWEIGLRAGWLVDIGIAVHPVAMANFFTGFFLVRLTDTEEL